jgi:tRNA (adenine57-N1/adenine58-N1)-methyltransferase
LDKIKEGDYVLLYFDNRREWLLKASKEKEFHTHKGMVPIREVIGKSYGERIQSALGYDFWLLKPNSCDFLSIFKRLTQIIYPKDAGLIILKLGISPGRKVIETGTGSGALTALMANLVKPEGHIYTYDMNERFLNSAKKNIRKLKVDNYVTFKNLDAREGFDEKDVDAIVIDVADPWRVVPHAYESLKGGCSIASFSPTINQVEKTVTALNENGFISMESIEILLREIHVEEGKTRPLSRMISHTGYLTFARKILV